MMHDFRAKLAEGEAHEAEMDSLFEGDFIITPATMEEQRRGIDRHFENRQNRMCFTVQYKADERAAQTGNAFVETVSVDTKRTPGWAHTCEADYILYWIVGPGPIYVFKPRTIRRHLACWEKEYRTAMAQNDGYRTHGILVPLDEFERHADRVL